MGRNKRKFKSTKTTSKRQDNIEKAHTFLKISQEALNELSKERILKLLDCNGQSPPENSSNEEVVKMTSEYMAFGLVQPCPDCGGVLEIKIDGYKCSKTGDTEEKCKYMNHSPPHEPFVIPEEFHDVPFFKEYAFEKLFREFANTRAKSDKKKEKKQWGDRGKNGDGYQLCLKENKLFEEYYKNQGVVPEGEYEEFMHKLREPLPSTFRVTGFGRNGKELLKSIQNDYLNKLCNIEVDDKKLEPPKCLEWYPDGLAWQLDVERKSIRHIPELNKLKQFLISETNAGNISRQEAVSMIPPLVLDIKPHHKVLDMCAAPGSKTSQLIEFLHSDESQLLPDGVVVANDADNKRCYLMCHQVKRLQTPCFMVVNHDATQFPGFKVDGELMKFDRVLADVPCTGDGTFRKNVDAWQKWNPAIGHNLHILQSRILRRGLDLLKTGGRLVYSTCSLNPIENEAVLSAVISEYGGEVEILDVSAELPGLKFLPGKSTWKVMSRAGDWFNDLSEVSEKLRTQIFSTMFPPKPEVAEKLHLERCIRILPHLQNTGGFFIAVLHKTVDPRERRQKQRMENAQKKAEEDSGKDDPIKDATANTESDNVTTLEPTFENDSNVDNSWAKGRQREEQRDYDNPPPLKRQKIQGYKEDPFIFLEKADNVMDAIKSFYGLGENFPCDQIMVRSKEGKKRNLYFVSHTVRQLVNSNEDKIKFINMGVKLFTRSESKYCTDCNYRLVQEGIEVLYPYMEKRIINVSRDDLVKLLTKENPYINQLSDVVQKQMKELESDGSIVYVFDPDNNDFEKVEKPQCKLIVTGWKGVVSARTFLPVSERSHFLRLCGIELKTKEELQIEKDRAARNDQEQEGEEEYSTTDLNTMDEEVEMGEGILTNELSDDNGQSENAQDQVDESTESEKLSKTEASPVDS